MRAAAEPEAAAAAQGPAAQAAAAAPREVLVPLRAENALARADGGHAATAMAPAPSSGASSGSRHDDARLDRARGLLVGLAAGDRNRGEGRKGTR